jgi:hypothetical protein
VAVKYRKKIELMVRKPDKAEEPEEVYTDCPFCSEPGSATEMQCAACQNTIPFDIATGTAPTAFTETAAANLCGGLVSTLLGRCLDMSCQGK